mmetsp:Transcript_37511/g.54924  ORF Transcript_37511/g.54924 Transcript_37511/m.54924 type:complete len:88 (+) Transcript_37511:194-457(+)
MPIFYWKQQPINASPTTKQTTHPFLLRNSSSGCETTSMPGPAELIKTAVLARLATNVGCVNAALDAAEARSATTDKISVFVIFQTVI